MQVSWNLLWFVSKHVYRKSNSSNNSCCLGLSFLNIIEAMSSIPYSSITDEVFIINKLLLEKVSNQCSNNLHRALCLLSSVEYRINMVELFFLKNSSMMAITVSLTNLSRGDFLLFKFAITN